VGDLEGWEVHIDDVLFDCNGESCGLHMQTRGLKNLIWESKVSINQIDLFKLKSQVIFCNKYF
jgi:hypothetical protein